MPSELSQSQQGALTLLRGGSKEARKWDPAAFEELVEGLLVRQNQDNEVLENLREDLSIFVAEQRAHNTMVTSVLMKFADKLGVSCNFKVKVTLPPKKSSSRKKR